MSPFTEFIIRYLFRTEKCALGNVNLHEMSVFHRDNNIDYMRISVCVTLLLKLQYSSFMTLCGGMAQWYDYFSQTEILLLILLDLIHI